MMIMQQYINASIEVAKNEEKLKAKLVISAEALHIGGQILYEFKEIKFMQKKLLTFMEYQHQQNTFM